MRQWDYLHAMLIYESLGLSESIRDVSESISWNHDAKAQGLNSPFLIKVRNLLLSAPCQFSSRCLAFPQLFL